MESFATERRVKFIEIPYTAMLRAAEWMFGEPTGIIRIPRYDGVPPGSVVLSVYHCPHSRTFSVLIYHPSFDEVADGERPPSVPCRPSDFTGRYHLIERGDGTAESPFVVTEPK